MSIAPGIVVDGGQAREEGVRLHFVWSEELSPGTVLKSGEWPDTRVHSAFFGPLPHGKLNGTLVWFADPDHMARREVEFVFDAVRAIAAAETPTRRRALFTALSVDEATERWRKGPRATFPVLSSVPLPGSRLFAAPVNFFNYAVNLMKGEEVGQCPLQNDWSPLAEVIAAAQAYWRGETSDALGPMRWEVLVEGNLEIVESPPIT